MKPKDLDEVVAGVFALNDPMFPLYLVRGEFPLLIDSGVARMAQTFLERIGRVLGEQKLARVVLTHSHWDHTGALTAICQHHQAEVLASAQTADLLQKDSVIAFINRLNRDFAPPAQRDNLPQLRSPERLTVIEDGERLPLDHGRSLRALATPGHTRCSQAYLLEPDGLLCPGDAVGVMERDGAIRPLFLSSYHDYLSSLQRLSRLPVSGLAFSHNRVIRGEKQVKLFFERSLQETQRWSDTIQAGLKAGKDENRIAEEFFFQAFSNTTLQSPREVFLINIIAMIRAVDK